MMTEKTTNICNYFSQELPQSFHEAVSTIVSHHYHHVLPKKGKPLDSLCQWTTLAAIIQSSHENTEDIISKLKVVSLATGTKCVGEKELSSTGDKISDSHAEVLSRRGFLLYLYDQIATSTRNPKNSIFDKVETSCSTTKTFVLESGISFHMFISQLPCGDASIFSNKNFEDDEEQHAFDSQKVEEQPSEKKKKFEEENKLENKDISSHRTGAKLFVGGSYEENQEIGRCRVKPGKGDPTLSMSCSDKLAKWQMVGLQGSLLTNFIPAPIRLSSITIGSGCPFNKNSLQRAIFTRFIHHHEHLLLQKISCPESYLCPSLAQSQNNVFNPIPSTSGTVVSGTSTTNGNSEFKPAPASIIWTLDEATKSDPKNVEVVVNGFKQGITKKFFGTKVAQVKICRQRLFSKFVKLSKELDHKNEDDMILTSESDPLTYAQAKRLSSTYFETWLAIKLEIMEGWTSKPENLSNFII